ncbi:MAG: methyltransferase domain-containing protein [Dehalococcoidia bacterium]|nr:methyltransferase domain-containing protein [Dehalococcoidia bacterium]
MSVRRASTDFDAIAASYDESRRANPALAATLGQLFEGRDGPLLDLGCGTGNYGREMGTLGHEVVGVDASPGMLGQAVRKLGAGQLVLGDAQGLPFGVGAFSGVFSVLVLHHVPNWQLALDESVRVLGAGGRLVVFYGTQEQYMNLWLWEYLLDGPDALPSRRPGLEESIKGLRSAGFARVETQPFSYTTPEDAALFVGAHAPELYLDPNVQRGIRVFRNIEPSRLEAGFERLRRDVESGAVTNVMARHQESATVRGDCTFFVADL